MGRQERWWDNTRSLASSRGEEHFLVWQTWLVFFWNERGAPDAFVGRRFGVDTEHTGTTPPLGMLFRSRLVRVALTAILRPSSVPALRLPPSLSLSFVRSSSPNFPSSRRFFATSPSASPRRPPLRPITPCLKFTPLAAQYFAFLLDEAGTSPTPAAAVILRYSHSTSGLNRMVFSFSYLSP